MRLVQTVWLTSPENLKNIDFSDPKSTNDFTSLAEPGLNMESHGWVNLGSAVIEYEKLLDPKYTAVLAASRIDDAIAVLQARTETQITDLRRVQQELLCLEAPAND